MKPARIFPVLGALLLAVALVAQVAPVSNVAGDVSPADLAAIERIKAEAMERSQVMELARSITAAGPRLTNTAGAKTAGEFAQKKLVEWKLADVKLDPWTFGSGWTNDRFTMKVDTAEPGLSPLRVYVKPWTPGTNGPVKGEVVLAFLQTEADFDKFRGKLRGKFVLLFPQTAPRTVPQGIKRFTDDELKALSGQPAAPAPGATPPTPAAPQSSAPSAPPATPSFFAWVESAATAPVAAPAGPIARPQPAQPVPAANRVMTREKATAFFLQEGVLAMIEPPTGVPTVDGVVFLSVPVATGEATPWSNRTPQTPKVPPQVVLAQDQYNKLLEVAEKRGPVTLELDVKNTYNVVDRASFNVLGDIKGSDKPAELVMLGAHLDSWHLSAGATDNAAGVAVVMEAARILRTLALPMHRTVRLGLWTGEEQVLRGSNAYVSKVFMNSLLQEVTPNHGKLSAYFNVDNGTGLIRGVNMQGNVEITPIFEKWMTPFKSWGMTTLAPRSVPGSDHVSFDNVGLPAFQFIQDPIEYDTRTHHSNVDNYDRLIKDDLMKNAAILASFAYLAANRDELLPRKPLPRSVRLPGSPIP